MNGPCRKQELAEDRQTEQSHRGRDKTLIFATIFDVGPILDIDTNTHTHTHTDTP